MNDLVPRLLALADPANAAFCASLIPGIDPATMLGVRIPALRTLAREVRNTPAAEAFLRQPHRYHDERLLHGILLGLERDFARAMRLTEEFLPQIDNWATCDITAGGLKRFRRHAPEAERHVAAWLDSPAPYTVRFGIVVLLSHFLDEHFRPAHLDRLAALRSDHYYVNMALAWYFSIALVKHYDTTLPLLTDRRLDRWVHNKTIQKARESLRIAPARKAELQELKY